MIGSAVISKYTVVASVFVVHLMIPVTVDCIAMTTWMTVSGDVGSI
jgi:hypothetical protein